MTMHAAGLYLVPHGSTQDSRRECCVVACHAKAISYREPRQVNDDEDSSKLVSRSQTLTQGIHYASLALR